MRSARRSHRIPAEAVSILADSNPKDRAHSVAVHGAGCRAGHGAAADAVRGILQGACDAHLASRSRAPCSPRRWHQGHRSLHRWSRTARCGRRVVSLGMCDRCGDDTAEAWADPRRRVQRIQRPRRRSRNTSLATRYPDPDHSTDLVAWWVARIAFVMQSTVCRLAPIFSCKKCGGRLQIPQHPIISCKACGEALGSWAGVKREMKEAARNAL
jgi:hypothetical protein